jgi:hypothetical protein
LQQEAEMRVNAESADDQVSSVFATPQVDGPAAEAASAAAIRMIPRTFIAMSSYGLSIELAEVAVSAALSP